MTDHPVRPFLLARAGEVGEPWATMIRGLVTEHDVVEAYGFRKVRYLPSAAPADDEAWRYHTDYDWDAPHDECPTACGACSDLTGGNEATPMPHPCPTLLEVAWVFRHHPEFDPAWLPSAPAIHGELAPPALERP